jgi:hypoxanthine phosphoribosyltransferase
VHELGADIGSDYAGLNPLLVCSLKAGVVFGTDLSRALGIPHELDFLQLEKYRAGGRGVRFTKDLQADVTGRHVVVVEDVVDTGLTLNYVVRALTLRGPASLAVATLLDRPYRRLIDDLPVRYVGFTVPDELFVGYGFDVDERYRNLPGLHVYRARGAA